MDDTSSAGAAAPFPAEIEPLLREFIDKMHTLAAATSTSDLVERVVLAAAPMAQAAMKLEQVPLQLVGLTLRAAACAIENTLFTLRADEVDEKLLSLARAYATLLGAIESTFRLAAVQVNEENAKGAAGASDTELPTGTFAAPGGDA